MYTKFTKGITEKQIKELIEYANSDPDVAKYTRDPVRFKDREAFERWLHRDKGELEIYTLTNREGDLLGIIWLRELPILVEGYSDYKITFVIRIYGEARGKGLGLDFMKRAVEDFGDKKLWLETSADNIPAVKLYSKFGFKKITEPNSENKIFMVYG